MSTPHNPDWLQGHCMRMGDDEDGQPRLVIHTSREEVIRFQKESGENLVYKDVEIRLRAACGLPPEEASASIDEHDVARSVASISNASSPDFIVTEHSDRCSHEFRKPTEVLIDCYKEKEVVMLIRQNGKDNIYEMMELSHHKSLISARDAEIAELRAKLEVAERERNDWHKEAASHLDDSVKLTAGFNAELTTLRERMAKVQQERDKWRGDWSQDTPLPEDAQIEAAHPMETNDHKTYEEALRLVRARHSKFGLVNLVNWLLHSRDLATAAAAAMKYELETMGFQLRTFNLNPIGQSLLDDLRQKDDALDQTEKFLACYEATQFIPGKSLLALVRAAQRPTEDGK